MSQPEKSSLNGMSVDTQLPVQEPYNTPSNNTNLQEQSQPPKQTLSTKQSHIIEPELDFKPLPPEREKSAHPETFNVDIISFIIGPFVGLVAGTQHFLGFPPLFILATCVFIGWLFVYRLSISPEFFVRILCYLTIHTFFRELKSSNEHRIPEKGPVIFVCAPHANQFLDPAVVMEFVDRPVSFLIAAKSYRQGLVGALAHAQRSIPVERPQDLARRLEGKVTVDKLKITGHDTHFLRDFNSTDSILIANSISHIAKIVSDTEIILKEELECKTEPDKQYTYKLVPKVNQNKVYKYVWRALADGHCVGIFPEGGSHDRTELLPLKAGVALMALGAANEYPGLDIKIVTVGLNYFHGHRFRGRVYVEFSDPFSLPKNLIEQYSHGGSQKIEACNSLLDIIRDQLRTVTVSAPSWEQLQILWAVRRLYQPSKQRLPPKLKMFLIRRFADGYEVVKDRPEVVNIVNDINDYIVTLKDYGLRDHQIVSMNYTRLHALIKLITRFIKLITIVIFAVPGIILNAPIILFTRFYANKKAQEALRSSNVKIAARDVLASWKVLTSYFLIPLVFVVYPTIAALIGYFTHGKPLRTWGNFAVLQPFMMWASSRASEISLNIYRSLRPLVISVFDKTGNRDILLLRERRNELKTRLRKLVDELGPEIYGPEFKDLRLFNSELLYGYTDGGRRKLDMTCSQLDQTLKPSISSGTDEEDNTRNVMKSSLIPISENDHDQVSLGKPVHPYLKTSDSDTLNTKNIMDKNVDEDRHTHDFIPSRTLDTEKDDIQPEQSLASPSSSSDTQELLVKHYAKVTKKLLQDYEDSEQYKEILAGLGPIHMNDSDVFSDINDPTDALSLHSMPSDITMTNSESQSTSLQGHEQPHQSH